MIARLKGTLLGLQGDRAVVDVGGVGFGVHVPGSTAARLPKPGETVTLHVHTHVRDDVLALYGFGTEDELVLFRDIIGVSGAGPRVALTSLSTLSPGEFRRAVLQEDVPTLTRISGVGKKTAQRLILELKGKLSPGADDGDGAAEGEAALPVGADDALAALVALGYTEAEALPALRQAAQEGDGATADAGDVLRRALRHLAG